MLSERHALRNVNLQNPQLKRPFSAKFTYVRVCVVLIVTVFCSISSARTVVLNCTKNFMFIAIVVSYELATIPLISNARK